MERLSANLLHTSLCRAKIKPQVEASQILSYLELLFVQQWGDKVKNRIKPISIKDDVVHVAVISSVLASEIRLREQLLIKKIDQRFGQTGIRKILIEF